VVADLKERFYTGTNLAKKQPVWEERVISRDLYIYERGVDIWHEVWGLTWKVL